MEWDWNFVKEIIPILLRGVMVTIQATILGSIFAMIVGLFWAVLRRSRSKFISRPVWWFTDFVRGTPLLVQLYFLFYVLPDIGILLSPPWPVARPWENQ